MKKSNYTKFQRIVAFLLFLNHTLISCSCKKNPTGDGKQQEQSNKQSKAGRSSTSSPTPNTNNQATPSVTSPTLPEATHETVTNPNRQPDDSISPTKENLEAYLTEEEVIDSMPFSPTEELVSSDGKEKSEDEEKSDDEEKGDEEKEEDNENEAAIQDKPSYQANPIPADNPTPDAEPSGLATLNQSTPIPFSPLLQHTPHLPQKDSNLPTNPPSTYPNNNPSNKNNPNTVTPNLFKPEPNTTSSPSTQPKKKIASISPIKKQPIPLVGEQRVLAKSQQQARQQSTQDLPSEHEKKRAAHEAERARLYAELEEIQQRVARKVALERAQKKQAEEQDNLDEQDEQKDRIERQQKTIESLIKDRQDTELRKHSLKKLMKFSPQLFKELCLELEEKRIRQELRKLTESVSRNQSGQGFTTEQQDIIRYELSRLEKLIRKSQKAVIGITHLLANPEENWHVKNGKKAPIYTKEDLIMAQENVAASQAVRTQLETLVTSRGENPASYQPEPHIARTLEEKQAYKQLEILFHDPANAGAIFKDLSAQADALLKQLDNQPHLRQQLLPQAELLAEQFSKFHSIIEKKAVITAELYAKADPVTLATRPLEQGISRYRSLKVIENASSDYRLLLCDKFNTEVSSGVYYFEKFTGKPFRKFFDKLAALLEPGSELLTNLPKGTSLPTTAQAQAALLIDHGVKYIKHSGIAENFQGFVDKQSPLYQEAQNMLIYLIEKKKNGSPDPSRLQTLLKPFSTASHVLTTATADNQKERDTSDQPVVANDPIAAASDSSALQLNTAEIKQQAQTGKNLSEKYEQQPTNSSLNDPIYSPVLQEPIEQQLDYTESQPDDLLTAESAELFDQVCAEITEYLSNPTHVAELAHNAQQQVQEFIRLKERSKTNRSQSEKEALQKKASDLMEALLELVSNFNDQLNNLNRQKESSEEPYVNCDRINRLIIQQSLEQIYGFERKIETIKKSIETTTEAISQLCEASDDITETAPNPSTSTVTSPAIEEAIETALNLIVGKELSEVLTGRSPAPETIDDACTLAAEAALGLMSKATKFFGDTPANKRILDYTKRVIKAVANTKSKDILVNATLAGEPDISFQPKFKSTAEALAALHSYFRKSSNIKTTPFREKGLGLLKQIEQLKRIEKHAYRTSQNPHILDDLSWEGAELLDKKQKVQKDNLALLRKARAQLKAHLQPTPQELQECHIRTRPTSDTKGEAIIDSSDDERDYSRAYTAQGKGALAVAATIIARLFDSKNKKSTLKKKAKKEPLSGVYELGTTDARYIGQSENMVNRVKSQLEKDAKLKFAALKNTIYYSMPGSTKLERQVYAQFLINKYKLQNPNGLLNLKEPMGNRTDLYNSELEGVIKKFNLRR
jgi:hypothetical protein